MIFIKLNKSNLNRLLHVSTYMEVVVPVHREPGQLGLEQQEHMELEQLELEPEPDY